jgi:hypothetical protein
VSSPKPALRLMSSADRTAPRYPAARTGAARRFLRERVYPAFRVPALLAYRMRLRFLFAISFFSPYDIIEFSTSSGQIMVLPRLEC